MVNERSVLPVEGRHAPSRSLRKNTIVAALWGQGTIIVSAISIPFFTRLLSLQEYGLWLQLLALSALAMVADMGMASVFLRRLASSAAAERNAYLSATVRFYRLAAGLLGTGLLVVILIPGGIVAPFAHVTTQAVWTGVTIAIVVAINLACRPYSIVLLARGDMFQERLFGAAPGATGTIATIGAAWLWHTAFAMALAYAVVELAFNLALSLRVKLTRSPVRQSTVRWRGLFREGAGVLVIDAAPQLIFAVDAVLLAHLQGPAAVALFGVALKGADLVRRFFSPMVESLYVSMCRARNGQRTVIERCALRLPWSMVLLGGTLVLGMAVTGPKSLRLLFGAKYSVAAPTLVILTSAAILRSVIGPQLRRLQAAGALGRVPAWFAAGILLNAGLVYFLVLPFSILGAALAILIVTLSVECVAVIREVWRKTRDDGAVRLTLRQIIAVVGIASLGTAILGFNLPWSAIVWAMLGATSALGLFGLSELHRYMVIAGDSRV